MVKENVKIEIASSSHDGVASFFLLPLYNERKKKKPSESPNQLGKILKDETRDGQGVLGLRGQRGPGSLGFLSASHPSHTGIILTRW